MTEKTKKVPKFLTADDYNPEAFYTVVDSYLESCRKAASMPDEAGMRVALRLTKEDITALEKKDPVYRRILDWAMDMRESMLVRRMVSEPKLAQGCLNALKQSANGGYTDKPAENNNREITVKVVGVTNGEELFK